MSEDSLENDYFIESINIRIEDSSTGEGYYLTQTYDLGDCGFHEVEPPTKMPESIDNKLIEIAQLKKSEYVSLSQYFKTHFSKTLD